ncbi:MAG: NAD(P)-dependent oxidoreductase [Rhodobacteraceae bacterium]|nr:NAD(P)-dependent oxidoreductase [Paracoccaceae bacterium]
MARVAFIGLGVMGYPMAGHLARAGHELCVYNRTTAKAEAWVAAHGHGRADSPAKAARGAEFVMTCVGNDDDLRAVVTGPEGALAGMEAGGILVDHSTVSADVTRALHAQAEGQGIALIDAPISGGQAGAENGVLSVMCGGGEEAFARAAPVIESYARICRLMGPSGAGQLTKMVNQICIAGLVQGLSEGLAFARAAGLDGASVVEVISQGAAGSWQMANRHETMLEGRFAFGFAVVWMRKALAIGLAEAERHGAQLPVTALVDQFYKDVQAMGGGRWDTSSLIARLSR